MAKNTKTIAKTDGEVVAPKKTRKPRVAKASGEKTKQAVVEAAPKVEAAVNDVYETMKTELEEVIAEKVPQAPENSRLNKALRNAAIGLGGFLLVVLAWNFLF